MPMAGAKTPSGPSLNALLDDEASKLRILDYLRKWLGDNLEETRADRG
jgi:hypothetical protein